MTKRIIDSMSAQEIATGWDCGQEDILDYLETICKPAPNWKDDVSLESPIACYVGDSLEELGNQDYLVLVQSVVATLDWPYTCTRGTSWKHARPIDPNECWKPPAIVEHEKRLVFTDKDGVIQHVHPSTT